MFQALFTSVSGEERSAAIARIIARASPRADFFLMMMLAIAMASMGVLTDSVVILIGSMLIAPMLYPLLALSLGIVLADPMLVARSFYTLVKATIAALIAAFVIGVFFVQTDLSTIKVVSGSVPTLAYALVAAISGFAAAFAMTKETLNEMLPGVAIAVALVPPLAVAGVGLAHFDFAVFVEAFLLFATNVVGVVLSATVVFSLFGFFVERRFAARTVQEDENQIALERIKNKTFAPPTPTLR